MSGARPTRPATAVRVTYETWFQHAGPLADVRFEIEKAAADAARPRCRRHAEAGLQPAPAGPAISPITGGSAS